MSEATIENGFAQVADGVWLMSRGQPAAFRGTSSESRLRGWIVPDRAALVLRTVASGGSAHCADGGRPFLTRLDAPAEAVLSVVSAKILLAPAAARTCGRLVRVIPMSFRGAVCTTEFASGWVVAATRSRTTRIALAEGETLSVRPAALVAWTGRPPTGSVPRIRLRDIFLPCAPRSLLLNFYGPSVVWIEGTAEVARPPRWGRRVG